MANKKTFIFVIGAFLLICAFFPGCLDNPVSPYGGIKGKILGLNGFPEEDIGVTRGHYPVVYTNASGEFSFDYAVRPYDVVFTRESFYDPYPVKYLSLNNSNTNLYDFQTHNESYSRIFFTVSYPPLDSNKRLIIKFISSEPFMQNDFLVPEDWPDTIFSPDLYFSATSSMITGKLLYLEFTSGPNGIISFDNYCVKDFAVSWNLESYVCFTKEELKVPQSSGVSFNITRQNGSAGVTYSYLNFGGMKRNSEIQLEGNGNANGSFQLPLIPEFDCYLRISNQTYLSEKWVFTRPGENASIVQESPLTLLLPPDDQSGITDTSSIVISDDVENGIYCYTIMTSGIVYNLVTDRKQIKLDDLNSYYFRNKKGKQYRWYVTKYGKCSTLNDFVSGEYFESMDYSSKSRTNLYYFTTAP